MKVGTGSAGFRARPKGVVFQKTLGVKEGFQEPHGWIHAFLEHTTLLGRMPVDRHDAVKVYETFAADLNTMDKGYL